MPPRTIFSARLLFSRRSGAGTPDRLWHEYGHALSLVRATPEQRRDGLRLLELLPAGLRAAIDYPGGYRGPEVFDEVIATVYALLVGRVRDHGYRGPAFLHADVLRAFKEVLPWPPTP